MQLAIIMASEDPKMSRQGTAGNRKHLTLTVLQKLEIFRRLHCGKTEERL
jgi:hypothetical protein